MTDQFNDLPAPEDLPQSDPATDPTPPKTKAQTANLKDAWKQVENIGQTIGEALQSRQNVVMVRVNDETLAHLDMLVETEIVKSRSEAAALLINEGIKVNNELFEKIRKITDQIGDLRKKLKETVTTKQEG